MGSDGNGKKKVKQRVIRYTPPMVSAPSIGETRALQGQNEMNDFEFFCNWTSSAGRIEKHNGPYMARGPWFAHV